MIYHFLGLTEEKAIRLIKKLFAKKPQSPDDAVIVTRKQHNISRKRITANALKVLYRLHNSGYESYLVGGGVRDLLLGAKPKDFDVVTNALPQEVRKLFRNSLLIGKRFRLVHVRFGSDIVEVATFRAGGNEKNKNRVHAETGMIMRDNVYGTRREDAFRRDFSINALYYNIADFSVVDYTYGMEDLKYRLIRIIGDPQRRYHEDPVRLLRAVRLSAKLDFQIEKNTEQPIFELGGLLQNVAPSRLFEEMLKLFYCGKSAIAFDQMRHYGLFAILFPQVEAMLTGTQGEQVLAFLKRAFRNTDTRIAEDKSLNPAFIFAVLLWWPLNELRKEHEESGLKRYPALNEAMKQVVRKQSKVISIPKRFVGMMHEIWLLQFELSMCFGKYIARCFYHPRFRASFDFLLLRAETSENVQDVADWWAEFQTADSAKKQKLIKQAKRRDK